MVFLKGKKDARISKNLNYQPTTIAALATPPGFGGIGIIRISGPNAICIAHKIFKRAPRPEDTRHDSQDEKIDNASHRFRYGFIIDPESNALIDEVILVAMKAPRSYTREDVVEIQSHSGSIVLSLILELILRSGAFLAEPGEFTKRAFLNGRIDLSQAEAVCDIVWAKSEKSLQMAQGLLTGSLKKAIESVKSKILEAMAELQAKIEFSDEIGAEENSSRLQQSIQTEIIEPLENLIQTSDETRIFREGIRLAVVGRPNVGKSSLLNCLLEKERSIVTPYPGTTRDIIEDFFTVQGIPVIISDTAGIHKTRDPVEKIGIRKAYENIAGADLIFFLVDATDPFNTEDYEIYQKIEKPKVVFVINKIDLVGAGAAGQKWEAFSENSCVHASALLRLGIKELKDSIVGFFKKDYTREGLLGISLNIRQRKALQCAAEALRGAIQEMRSSVTEDLAALNFQESLNYLGEVSGESLKIDILDTIFQKFCIGK
jgi:tRNA modification GTPase